MFEMKDEYRLGVELIDNEHEKLFEIGERAYQLLNDEFKEDKYNHIVEIIEELKDYTVTHFKDEEAYMMEIGYNKSFSHKVEHEDFINKVNSVDLYKMDENQDKYIMGILNFLAEWLVSHILEKDLKIVGR